MLSLMQLLHNDDDHPGKNEKNAKEEKMKYVMKNNGMWCLNIYCIVSFIHEITIETASFCHPHILCCIVIDDLQGLR